MAPSKMLLVCAALIATPGAAFWQPASSLATARPRQLLLRPSTVSATTTTQVVVPTAAAVTTSARPASRRRWVSAGVVGAAAVLLNWRRLLAVLSLAHHAYEAAAVARPLITKASTSGVAYLLGDLLAQRVVASDAAAAKVDRARAARSAVAGFLSHGPQCHFWGLWLDANVRLGGPVATLAAYRLPFGAKARPENVAGARTSTSIATESASGTPPAVLRHPRTDLSLEAL